MYNVNLLYILILYVIYMLHVNLSFKNNKTVIFLQDLELTINDIIPVLSFFEDNNTVDEQKYA